MEKLIKTTMEVDKPQEEEINPALFNNFMKQIAIWDYSSISRNSYLALSYKEREKLIKNYYHDVKNRSSGEFNFSFFLEEKQPCLSEMLFQENL